MTEHHFTAEGAPCQRCRVLLDEPAAAEPCTGDRPVETLVALAAIAVTIVALFFL